MSAFTYWDSSDIDVLSPVVAHWQVEIGEFTVVGDPDVIRVLKEIDPEAIDMYERIRIPAARSDLARLVMLYQNGGLYVDSHCGVTQAQGVRDILSRAYTDHLILIDQSRAAHPRPSQDVLPINAMLVGGKRSPVLRRIIGRVIHNLHAQRREEAMRGFLPYDLLQLTGPKNISDAIAANEVRFGQGGSANITLHQEENFPVQRYRYKLVGRKSAHWTERQKTERLFDN
jgi:mannosyltransferase OCH1-like enzyme